MSAYSIGADTTRVVSASGKREAPDRRSTTPETLVKWIPGEAITFYAAILGLDAAQAALTGKESADEILERINAGSLSWFLTGTVVAVVLVIIGALTTPATAAPGTRASAWGVVIRVVLTVAAFAFWTSALPGSWTYGLHFVRDLGPAYAFLLVPVGLAFGAIAEQLTKRARF